jgi:hypothetical protein
MNDAVREVLGEQNTQLLYKRPRSRYADRVTHRVDLPRVLASNDMRALLEVSDIFGGNLSKTCMVVDRNILDSSDRSFMSFGLSSNDCTHLYLDIDPSPLFEIVENDEGSEYIRIACDGREFRSSTDIQYGIILRYAPDLETLPQRRWFLIAGLGPLGTTAAAKYLSKRWEFLSQSVGSGRSDFLAVVSTCAGSDDYPHLEAIYPRRPVPVIDESVES